MKGYTGEGFLGQGRKLGGRRMPLSEMSRQARASAAEKRNTLSKDADGRRLGGAPVMRGADMRRVIADAAIRRATITQGCASGMKGSQKLADQASRNGFRTKAEEDDANDRAIVQALMELMEEEESRRLDDSTAVSHERGGLGWSPETGLYIEDDDEDIDTGGQQDKLMGADLAPRSNHTTMSEKQSKDPVARNGRPVSRLVLEAEASAAKGRRPTATPASEPRISLSEDSRSTRNARGPPPPGHLAQATAVDVSGSLDNWTCPVCTLENPMQYLCCDACGIERPSSLAESSSIRQGTLDGRLSANAGQSAEVRPTIRSSSIGWTCRRCGLFMEDKWWTCAQCGTMKASS
ncbi:MAG: hypothetical protein Q9157_007352 [Trypethelium eluteriae]